MLAKNDVIRVLQVAQHYDGRARGEPDVLAWGEAARRGEWTLSEAVDAVHAHFAESNEWFMPAHVTTRIRTRRQEAERAQIHAEAERMRAELEPAAPPADPARIRAVVAELAARMGWNRPQRDDDTGRVLAVLCPHCHAAPGRPCARQITRGPRRGEFVPMPPHPSRIDLAAPNGDQQGATRPETPAQRAHTERTQV